MTTMNISIPEDLLATVEARMASRGLASRDEYIQQLIREDEERGRQAALERFLVDRLEGPPAEPMTQADWAYMREELARRMSAER